MQNDLISRSAAIEAVERREKLMCGDKRVAVDSFKNFLLNRPIVDAEPVRHGSWYYGECSACKGICIHYKPPYCPNCGAKMDLEVE